MKSFFLQEAVGEMVDCGAHNSWKNASLIWDVLKIWTEMAIGA